MPDVDVLATANTALEQLVPRTYEAGVRFVELRPGYLCAEVPAEGCLASGCGPLKAAAALPGEEVARTKAAAAPGGKVSFQFLAEVPGADGGLVARTHADYRLRALGRR